MIRSYSVQHGLSFFYSVQLDVVRYDSVLSGLAMYGSSFLHSPTRSVTTRFGRLAADALLPLQGHIVTLEGRCHVGFRPTRVSGSGGIRSIELIPLLHPSNRFSTTPCVNHGKLTFHVPSISVPKMVESKPVNSLCVCSFRGPGAPPQLGPLCETRVVGVWMGARGTMTSPTRTLSATRRPPE